MITVVKEKNLMKIYVEGTNGYYTFDIATGAFLGKKGSQLVAVPSPHEIKRAFYNLETNLGYAVGRRIDYNGSKTAPLRNVRNINAYLGAEKLDNIGIGVLGLEAERYAYINDNFQLFVKYAKEHPITREEFAFRDFESWATYEKQKTQLGQYLDIITVEMFNSVTNCGQRTYTAEEWSVLAYYLVRGKYWEYNNGSGRLVEYIEMCRAMEKTPNKQNNFMREWCETNKEYQLRKQEFDNKVLQEVYKAREKAFTFSFGEYSVVIPKTTQDIIDEGRNMHHCVGGYVNRVLKGDCFIVFVRKTDTPDQCYITAQVHSDGTLGQYYLAYDRYIREQADFDFYREFANHLAKNW
jgi:hypothetical protein